MKKSVLLFSLVFSILTLIYLISAQYGYGRYLGLHFRNSESYIDNYTKLDKADKDRVVIAFSGDSKNLTPFINSLLDQTVRVDDIALTIPYKKLGEVKELNKAISKYGYSKEYSKDSGKDSSIANLISSVLREPDSKTKIILVEPNMIYSKDFVETMVEKSNNSPDSIIYGDKSKDVKYGILIKPSFFNEKISEYEEGNDCLSWMKKCCKAKEDCADCSCTYRRM
jgi:hypothetical protein